MGVKLAKLNLVFIRRNKVVSFLLAPHSKSLTPTTLRITSNNKRRSAQGKRKRGFVFDWTFLVYIQHHIQCFDGVFLLFIGRASTSELQHISSSPFVCIVFKGLCSLTDKIICSLYINISQLLIFHPFFFLQHVSICEYIGITALVNNSFSVQQNTSNTTTDHWLEIHMIYDVDGYIRGNLIDFY